LRAQRLGRRRREIGVAMQLGELVIDPAERVVTLAGRRLDLPYTEFKLLAHLAARPGTAQSWQELLGAVWGTHDLLGGRDVVKSTVYRLRARLAAAGDYGGYIQTIRGVGYLMPYLPPSADSTTADR